MIEISLESPGNMYIENAPKKIVFIAHLVSANYIEILLELVLLLNLAVLLTGYIPFCKPAIAEEQWLHSI